MEVGSRDDFIIAIRSAFLKKETKQRFSLIILIFFSLIFLVLGRQNFKPIDYVKISIREIIYRSTFIVSVPENYIKKTYLIIEDHFNLYSEYSKVKSELKKLKAQGTINDFIISENKRLKQVVDDYIVESEEIIAKILIDKNFKSHPGNIKDFWFATEYDDVIKLDASKVEPTVTWGITPGQSISINQQIPFIEDLSPNDKLIANETIPDLGIKGNIRRRFSKDQILKAINN